MQPFAMLGLGATLLASVALVHGAQARTPDDQLVMAWTIDGISTFDPAQIGEVVTDELIDNMCDTLVMHSVESEETVVPRLAESWDVSDDGRQITFHLRDDIFHPSGNPVTAHDMEWSMQRVLQLGFGNAASLTQWGFSTDNMEAAFQALDDKTFQMTLQEAYPPELILLAVMADRVSMPLDSVYLADHVQDGDFANGYLTTNTACVGPYHLRQWNAGEVVVLEANENYWGDAPAMRRVIVRHVPEASARRLLIEQGDVDVAREPTAEDLPVFEANPDTYLVPVRRHQLFYWGFDNANPTFADVNVREAMRYLIDYDGLAETVLKGVGIPRNTMVPLGAFAALDEEAGAPYELDFDKARELLAEAGHADGFEARLFISSSAPHAAPIAQHVAANAAQVGVTIHIEQMADAELFSRFRGRDFDTVMLSWSTSLPDAHGMSQRHAYNPDNSAEAQLTMFPTWRASWYNEEFNRLVDEAVLEQDPATRIALYEEIQKRHMVEGPFAYIFQQYRNTAVRSEVTAFPTHAMRVYYNLVTKD